MRSIVYHQFRKELHIIKTKFCISSLRKLFMHAKRCDEIQGRLAALDDIHRTSYGDDMPLLSQWIKKERSFCFVLFWLPLLDLICIFFRPRVEEKTPGKSKVSLTVRLTVAVPGGCPRRRSAFVPRRPLPLAPLPVSAPGGGRVAPYLLSYAQSVSQRPVNSQFLDAKASRKAKKEAHRMVCFFFGSPCWT